MLLLVGLGNPGPKYAKNRHNIGFMAVDEIARAYAFGPWRKKFQGEIAEGAIDGVKTLLLKPQTYMNESGRSVGDGAAGHNGIRSIIASPVGEGFRRARLGVGHPGQKELVHGYVLSDFHKAEADWVNALLDACARAAPLLVKGEDDRYQGEVMRLAPAEKADPRKGRGEEA
jgi:PTH1 family peptidyl-tRNA hydrolase